MSRYGLLTVPELKHELARRNARTSGKKEELINRYVVWACSVESTLSTGTCITAMSAALYDFKKVQ